MDSTPAYPDKLIQSTKELWSEKYGRPVSDQEANQLIYNATRFMRALTEMGVFE